MLLRHCAYVNAQDANGNTTLHYASTLTLQLCALLLRCGEDPNIKNISHETPLFRAVQGVNNALPYCEKIVNLLLNHGGSVVIRDLNQDNAIEVASRLDSKDILDSCKMNVKNSKGKSLIIIKLRAILFLEKFRNRLHTAIVFYIRILKV